MIAYCCTRVRLLKTVTILNVIPCMTLLCWGWKQEIKFISWLVRIREKNHANNNPLQLDCVENMTHDKEISLFVWNWPVFTLCIVIHNMVISYRESLRLGTSLIPGENRSRKLSRRRVEWLWGGTNVNFSILSFA